MSKYGDFNNDGIIGTVADLVYLESNLDTISSNNLQHHDLNKDGVIDASDVEYLANHIVGLPGYELPQPGIYVQNKGNQGKINIGHLSTSVDNAIIIGNNSTANHGNSILVGNNISTNESNQVVIGGADQNILFNGKSLKIPVGTTGERPDPAYHGYIRYNTDASTYEGFGAGGAWGSLGGVKDVDGDTKILAENNAGDDNDELKFFAGGNEVMRMDASGNIDISSNIALKIPVGTNAERPSASDVSLGQIRYNTDTSTYEGFGAGGAWGSLGGVKDVDGDTKILAENSAAIDNDELKFFAGGNESMRIDASGVYEKDYTDGTWRFSGFSNFKKYFSDSPPPVTFNSQHNSSGSKIFISWNYPEQIEMGAFNSYFPLIINFYAEWSANINNNIIQNQTLLPISQKASSHVIRYDGLTERSNYITGIVLTNVFQSNGYANVTFPDKDEFGNNIIRYSYVYYNSNFSNLLNDPDNNKVTVWYENNSTSVNKSSHSINVFLTAGPPGIPGIPTASTTNPVSVTSHPGYTTNGIRITNINAERPQWADDDLDNNDVQINNYKYNYYSSGDNTYRYGGPISHLGTRSTSTSNNISSTITFTELYPDSTYYISCSAKNNAPNTGYGEVSASGEFFTTNLIAPSTFSNFTSPFTTRSAKKVSDNTEVNNLIYNTLTAKSTSAFIAPIHTVATRGSQVADLLEYSVNITHNGVDKGSNSIKFSGYPSSDLPVWNPITPNYYDFNTFSKTDYYSSNSYSDALRGYYLNASCKLTFNSSLFTSSNEESSISLTITRNNDESGTSTTNGGGGTVSFHYDPIDDPPSVDSVTISLESVGTTTKISGVTVSRHSDIGVKAISQVSNIGNYFYNSTILSYSADTGSVGGSTSETELKGLRSSLYGNTDSTITTSVTFTNNTLTRNLGNTFTTSFNLKATTTSSNGRTHSATSNSLTILYDKLSYDLITSSKYPSSVNDGVAVPNIVYLHNTNWYTGYRIKSGNAVTSGGLQYATSLPDFDAWKQKYDHNELLTDNEELQINQGYYRTKQSNTTGYLNYGDNYGTIYSDNANINYTIIDDDYRYATFVWKLNSNSYTYNQIDFRIIGQSNKISLPTGSTATIGGSDIKIFTRLEDGNNQTYTPGTTPGTGSFLGGTFNTTWINPLSDSDPGLTSSNMTVVDSIKNSRKGSNVVSGGIFYFQLGIPATSITSSDNIYLYLRIGLPMNQSYYFEYVQARLRST